MTDECRPCDAAACAHRRRRTAENAWRALGIDPALCLYCGAPAEHADHVLPRNLGGTDEGNLVPACAPCNLSKNDAPLVWWAVRRFGDDAADVLAVLPEVDSPATRLRRVKAHGPSPRTDGAGGGASRRLGALTRSICPPDWAAWPTLLPSSSTPLSDALRAVALTSPESLLT